MLIILHILVMFASNCIVCGNEYDISTMRSVLSTASSYRVCDDCLLSSDPTINYQQVKKIVSSYIKFAQQINDPELASPDIKIEPADTLIQQAVNLLKKINPSYFVGVRKIVVDAGSSAYGYVESGQQKDPTVIHINLPKIKGEVQSKLSNLSSEEQQRELVRQIALVISHEHKHISPFAQSGKFAPETEAEAEAKSMEGKLQP